MLIIYLINKEARYFKRGDFRSREMACEQILRSWCACPHAGDLTAVPIPAFLFSLTGYPQHWNCGNSWPQKCGYETLWLHGKEIHAYGLLGTSVLASFPCGSTPVQKHLNPWSMASHCLLVTNVCFPRCLIASSPEATFLLHFFLMSILMDSWQISDLCFHSFTFPGGRFGKKKKNKNKQEVDTFWIFETETQYISFNISVICRWKSGDQFKMKTTSRLSWNSEEEFILSSSPVLSITAWCNYMQLSAFSPNRIWG